MKHLEAVLISLLAVFAPIKAVLLVTGFLIVADLVSGVMAAKKRGETINSAGLRRTLSKILVYNLAIVTGFLLETYMIDSILPVVKIIGGVIGVTEGLSIFENLNTISGTNVFKKVLDVLGSKNDTGKKEGSEEPPQS